MDLHHDFCFCHDTDEEPTSLSFLVHFVGDVHQPLHAGYECDAGGSKSHVEFFDKYMTLHQVWDSAIIDRYVSSSDWYQFSEELQSIIYQNPFLVLAYTECVHPACWADESYSNYVRYIVYNFFTDQRKGMDPIYPSNESCPFNSTLIIPDEYYDINIYRVKQRLIAGGIRLAFLLNTIFS